MSLSDAIRLSLAAKINKHTERDVGMDGSNNIDHRRLKVSASTQNLPSSVTSFLHVAAAVAAISLELLPYIEK